MTSPEQEPGPSADPSGPNDAARPLDANQPSDTATPPDAAATVDEAEEREWWDDPRLPWAHKPGRADLWCWGAIALVGVWSLVLLPLRPVLLTKPYVLGMLTGGWTGVTMMGAETAVRGGPWLLGYVVAVLSIMKFDWIYWWAGKLWGHGLIEIMAGRSARARRGTERALKVVHRFESLAIFLTYIPLPIPTAVVYIALGAAGMRLRKFLLLDFIAAAIAQAGYMYLGYSVGAPAVTVVQTYAQWLWYASLAILAGMLVTWWWRKRQNPAGA